MLSFETSPTTLIIVVLTSIISIIAFGNESLWRFLALEPFRMKRSREYHALLTSGFVHGSYIHLFLNMYVLAMFGPSLELVLGSQTFLLVYAISLLVGSIYPFIKYRDNPTYVAIGASGAISGVVFGFCLFWPTSTLLLFFVLPLPAIVFAVAYVAYSVFAMKRAEDNIGHEAHLAGGVGGLLATMAFRPDSLGIFWESISGYLS